MCVVKRWLDGARIDAHAPSSKPNTYDDRREIHMQVGRKIVMYLSLGLEQ